MLNDLIDCFTRYCNLKFKKWKNMKINFILMLRKEKLRFVTRPTSNAMCMMKTVIGGPGMVNGEGVTVKDV